MKKFSDLLDNYLEAKACREIPSTSAYEIQKRVEDLYNATSELDAFFENKVVSEWGVQEKKPSKKNRRAR